LADNSLFFTSLGAGFLVPALLRRRNLSGIQGAAVLALLPWALRFFLALPRWIIPGTAVFWDSLLLSLDRNNFVSLIPYYWAAFSSFFALGSRRFLRGDLIAQAVLLLTVFLMARTANIEAYRLPVLVLGCFGIIVFLQMLAFIFSADPAYRIGGAEQFGAAVVIFVLVLLGACLLIRPSEEMAVDQSGGLLQPKLFSFDFSQFLRLESEINVNTDLVLIIHKEEDPNHILLRRFILSGYNSKGGFYFDEARDGAGHPSRLPRRQWERPSENEIPLRQDAPFRMVDQEYYLVNFDAQALIGLNQIEEVTPFRTWDASSFNSAYAVRSRVNDALPFELVDAVQGVPGEANSGMDSESYRHYTDYGADERIAAKALEFTQGVRDYGSQVQMIYDALKYGEYRYSLKPGLAPDGDQLGYFLFEVKKGYCSYFAFAMTLLLRSQGIPARAAVGFFMDNDSGAFDYYPVRQNMAHAWVEVWFPGYGWVEYDPTSPYLAAGEDARFMSGGPQEQFEKLMEEILKNRSLLSVKTGSGEEERSIALKALGRQAGVLIRRFWPLVLFAVLVLTALRMRIGNLLAVFLSSGTRQKALRLWAHTERRLALGGFKWSKKNALPEWVKDMDARFDLGLYTMYLAVSAARFAPAFDGGEYAALKNLYGDFCRSYAGAFSPLRRLLAWLFPPLALMLPPRTGSDRGSGSSGRDGPDKRPGTMAGAAVKGPPGGKGPPLLLLLALCLFFIRGDLGYSQEGPGSPEQLYLDAMTAQDRENWDRAVQLLMEGSELYPGDGRFPWALGSLYDSRHLYSLAWEQFRKARNLVGDDPELLYQLSRTAALLNLDADAAVYLERLLQYENTHYRAIGDLGWIYYKLHRLAEGEALLLNALTMLGPDRTFSMTLGTIYADMFRYDAAKERYLEAIEESERLGDFVFSAVASYNLSILESRFYKYREAAEATGASLASADRPSGHLAQGELCIRQLDLSRAFAEYEAAYERDRSPLAKLSLAQAYQIAGRLDEARLYAEDCLASKDHSWMVNFGMNPNQYKQDIHEILWKSYRGLANRERLSPHSGPVETLAALGRSISYRFKQKTNRLLYEKYSLLSAGSYAAQGQSLDALSNYYNAFRSYRFRALDYLRSGRDYEVPLIPQALPSYEFEEADLLGRAEKALTLPGSFDAVFERDMIAEVYRSAAQKSRRIGARREAAERLYALNCGALIQEGIRLPVNLSLAPAENGRTAFAAPLVRALGKAGFEIRGESSRFELTVQWSDNLVWELYDTQRGRGILRRSYSSGELAAFGISARDRQNFRMGSAGAKALARALADTAFRQ
jgi:transglutaminase-like putative cysteine protease/tetratricopeptide (TPR) repeat protein